MTFFSRGRGRGKPQLSLYYASDVHGSKLCWRKFLAAGRFYGVQALIMGGDLAGKAVVPVVRQNGDGAYVARLMGEERLAGGSQQLEELLEAIRYNGMYPWVTSRAELTRLEAEPGAHDQIFLTAMLDELRQWIELADERIGEVGIPVYVMAGNDDPFECDEILEGAAHVQACDDRVVKVGEHEMISCSYANQTPWNSPRELDEDALYARFKRLAEQIEEPASAIFNLHVPPYDTGLDRAIEINPEDLTPVYRKGAPHEVPVGSKAVREIIEEYQPLLSLHGHIHESRGEKLMGRTLALNSGSEYNSGRIHGVVVGLTRDQVVSHQFTVG